MRKYKVTVERTIYFEVEVLAETAAKANQMGAAEMHKRRPEDWRESEFSIKAAQLSEESDRPKK